MEDSVRFGLMLRKVEKTYLEQLAQQEGGLSQAALIRRLIRKAALESGYGNPSFSLGKTQDIGVRKEYSHEKERAS
jgi:hypothetical protein